MLAGTNVFSLLSKVLLLDAFCKCLSEQRTTVTTWKHAVFISALRGLKTCQLCVDRFNNVCQITVTMSLCTTCTKKHNLYFMYILHTLGVHIENKTQPIILHNFTSCSKTASHDSVSTHHTSVEETHLEKWPQGQPRPDGAHFIQTKVWKTVLARTPWRRQIAEVLCIQQSLLICFLSNWEKEEHH